MNCVLLDLIVFLVLRDFCKDNLYPLTLGPFLINPQWRYRRSTEHHREALYFHYGALHDLPLKDGRQGLGFGKQAIQAI